jgi:hypothetical protein
MGKKSLKKQEIQNILSKDWASRRAKNKERSEKGSALTKKWKKQEKTLKELEKIKAEVDKHNLQVQLQNLQPNKKRRPNYITTPDSLF